MLPRHGRTAAHAPRHGRTCPHHGRACSRPDRTCPRPDRHLGPALVMAGISDLPSLWPGSAPRHGRACPGHPRLARRCRLTMPRVARADHLTMPPAGLTPHGEERSERSASRTMRPAKIAKDDMAQLNAASVQASDRHQDQDDEASFFPVEAGRQDDATLHRVSPTPSSTTRRRCRIWRRRLRGNGGTSQCRRGEKGNERHSKT